MKNLPRRLPVSPLFLVSALSMLTLVGCVIQPPLAPQPGMRNSYSPPPRSTPRPPEEAPVSLSESLDPSEQIVDIPLQSAGRKNGELPELSELSALVQRMALRNSCAPVARPSLIAKNGDVETYQISCQDGQQQIYKCELRQCRMMN